MSERSKYIFICTLFIISLCLYGCAQSDMTDTKQENIIDKYHLAYFNAYTLDEEIVNQEIFEDYDATMIFCWAPWSEVSVYELKKIGRFAEKLPDSVQLITICFDSETGDAKSIIKKSDMKHVTTLIDGDADFKTVSNAIANVPTTFYVDNKGNIIGDLVPGVQEDYEEIYLNKINLALKSIGKKKISLYDKDAAAEEETTEEKTTTTEDKTAEKDNTEEETSEEETEETDYSEETYGVEEDEESEEDYDYDEE